MKNPREILLRSLMSRLNKSSTNRDIETLLDKADIDPEEARLWRTFLRAYLAHMQGRHGLSAGLFKKLLKHASESWFISMVYHWIAVNHTIAGNASLAEKAITKAVEFSSDIQSLYPTMAQIYYIQEEFEKIRTARMQLGLKIRPEARSYAEIIADMVSGRVEEARQTLLKFRDALLAKEDNPFVLGTVLMILAYAERIQGNVDKAAKLFLESSEMFLSQNNYYAILPLNQFMDLSLSQDRPLPEWAPKVVRLARKGPLFVKAGLMEWHSIEKWRESASDQALLDMIEAGQSLRSAGQSLEAFLAYMRAGFLSYVHRKAPLVKTLDYILPRLNLYPFIEHDPIYGDFVRTVLKGMVAFEQGPKPKIVVSMLGPMKITGMKEASSWRSKKALSLFKYLLLNRGRGLPKDYLAYLVWPRKNPQKAGARLRQEISIIRKEMGELASLLSYKGGSYTLHEDPRLFCDVNRFQSVLREAESLIHTPEAQLQKLMTGLELYQNKLLPEDRYDRFIEEHRDHLHKRFQNALEKAVKILVNSDRTSQALQLAQEFYLRFPGDETVARLYIDTLVRAGRPQEANRVYQEFKKRLWRQSKLRPSFELPLAR